MIRVLAIDDEPLALRQLVTYISKVPFLELAGQCRSALEAREIMEHDVVDAIFCDINMPDLSGMDFVRQLAAPPLIVFTTAYSEYAIEGYKVNAVDYLLKPFGMNDFLRASMKIQEQYNLRHPNTPQQQSSPVQADGTKRDLHLKQALSQDRNGIAAVVGIEGIQNPLFFIEKDKLGRCGTAVDTEIAVCICARVKLAENMLVFIQGMTPEESLIVRFRRKKRTGFGSLLLNIPAPDQSTDPVNALVEIKVVGCTCRSARIKGSAERNHELRLLRDQNILILQLQLFPEGLDQGRMEA